MPKTQKMLACEMTQDEHISTAVLLSEKLSELAELEAEKKYLNGQIKAKTDALETEIAVLANNVKTGTEEREITCEWVYNLPRRGMKQLIRLDTKEVIEEMDMNDADKRHAADLLQTRIPMPE